MVNKFVVKEYKNYSNRTFSSLQWLDTELDQTQREITEIIISDDQWHRINRTKSFINLLNLITLTIFEVKITDTWRVLHQVNFHNGDGKLQCDIEARWRHYHGDGKVNVVKTEKFRFSCTKQVRFSPNMQPTQTICAVDSPTLRLGVWLLLQLL